jgi:hypothetical protein
MKLRIRIDLRDMLTWWSGVRDHAQSWQHEHYYFYPDSWRPAWWFVFEVLCQRFAYWYGSKVCALRGHAVELDEGTADNPYVDASCSRCGHVWPRAWW